MRVAATDQQTANALRTHFGEGDFLGPGHLNLRPVRDTFSGFDFNGVPTEVSDHLAK